MDTVERKAKRRTSTNKMHGCPGRRPLVRGECKPQELVAIDAIPRLWEKLTTRNGHFISDVMMGMMTMIIFFAMCLNLPYSSVWKIQFDFLTILKPCRV